MRSCAIQWVNWKTNRVDISIILLTYDVQPSTALPVCNLKYCINSPVQVLMTSTSAMLHL
jgi:hypothetical protein